jgi:CheY-like chemotaxis protein
MGNIWMRNEKATEKSLILLVDDSPDVVHLMQSIVISEGHQCKIARDGMEAILLLSESKFDLVFMDIQMPVMNGIKATSEIRKGDRTPVNKNVPIIAFTTLMSEGIENRCRQAGMDMYQIKPATYQNIKSILNKYLADENNNYKT